MNDNNCTGQVPGGESVPDASAPVEQKTAKLRVRIDPENDTMRLRWLRRGIVGEQVVEVSVDCPGLEGAREDGTAYLRVQSVDAYHTFSNPHSVAQDAIAVGGDVETAIRTYYKDIEARIAGKAAEDKAVEEKEARRRQAWKDALAQVLLFGNVKAESTYTGYRFDATVDGCVCSEEATEPSPDAIRIAVETAMRKAADKAEEKAKDAAADEADEEYRTRWIATFGSDALKRRVARKYDCARLYCTEMLAKELGTRWVMAKWDGRPDWELKDRSCPSDGALDLEDNARAAGFVARTHWVKWEHDADGYDESEYECEVVLIEDFHGWQAYALPNPDQAPNQRDK